MHTSKSSRHGGRTFVGALLLPVLFGTISACSESDRKTAPADHHAKASAPTPAEPSGSPPPAATKRPSELIVGTWTAEVKSPIGPAVTQTMTFAPDGSYRQTNEAGGEKEELNGTYKVEGDKLDRFTLVLRTRGGEVKVNPDLKGVVEVNVQGAQGVTSEVSMGYSLDPTGQTLKTKVPMIGEVAYTRVK